MVRMTNYTFVFMTFGLGRAGGRLGPYVLPEASVLLIFLRLAQLPGCGRQPSTASRRPLTVSPRPPQWN